MKVAKCDHGISLAVPCRECLERVATDVKEGPALREEIALLTKQVETLRGAITLQTKCFSYAMDRMQPQTSVGQWAYLEKLCKKFESEMDKANGDT